MAYALLFSIFAVNKWLTGKFLTPERGSYIVTVGIDIPDDIEEEYDEWMRKQVSYSLHRASFAWDILKRKKAEIKSAPSHGLYGPCVPAFDPLYATAGEKGRELAKISRDHRVRRATFTGTHANNQNYRVGQ
jgi:hypothetical protein